MIPWSKETTTTLGIIHSSEIRTEKNTPPFQKNEVTAKAAEKKGGLDLRRQDQPTKKKVPMKILLE